MSYVRRAALGALLVLGAAVAGCSSSTPPAHHPTAVARAHSPAPAPSPADLSPRRLAAGQCFSADPVTRLGVVDATSTVRTVPCTSPHDAEVFGRFTVAGPDYPGTQFADIADWDCANLTSRYDMDIWTVGPSTGRVRWFLPSLAQWRAGDHDGVCFWSLTRPVATSLRRDRTNLTPDQYAYLGAADALQSALDGFGDLEPSDDLDEYQGAADGVVQTLGTQVQILRSRTWAPAARPAVTALEQRMTALVPPWRDTAQSADKPTLMKRLAAARAATTEPQDRAVRAALALPTTRVR
jgi:hypothetical protein